MRILIISPLFPPQGSGAEISTMLECKELVENDVSLVVVTNSSFSLKRDDEWMKKIRIYRIPMPFISFVYPSVKPFGEFLYWLFQGQSWDIIEKIALRENADVLHIEHAFIGFKTSLNNKPIVLTIRDYWPICIYRTLWRGDGVCDACSFKGIVDCRRMNYIKIGLAGFSRLLYGSLSPPIIYPLSLVFYRLFKEKLMQVDKIVTISTYLKEILKRTLNIKESLLEVVYPPIPRFPYVQREVNSQRTPISFTYFGSLAVHKGILNLLKAFALAIRKNPDIRLNICGTGILQHYIEDFIQKYSLGKNVTLLGHVKYRDLIKIYKITDIVVVPSLWPEPFGRVTCEAMVAGRPVLVNPVGGLKEQIIDGFNGFHVNCYDIDEFAEGIIKISEMSRQKLLQMGLKAREDVLRRFSSEKRIRNLLKIYDSLI